MQGLNSYQIYPLDPSRCNMREDMFPSCVWRRSQHLKLYWIEW